MYIIHFMKYEDELLTDAWTSDDYFRTELDAEKWLLTLGGRGGKFVQDDTFRSRYNYEEDDIRDDTFRSRYNYEEDDMRIEIRTEAEIKYVYERLGS